MIAAKEANVERNEDEDEEIAQIVHGLLQRKNNMIKAKLYSKNRLGPIRKFHNL